VEVDRETLLAGGRYRLVRRIACGGVASVYEAVVPALGKRVAVKLMDPRFLGSREVVERFRLEARAASAIESEHIVDVHDVGEDERLGLYMVMELLQGEDLRRRLAREGRLAPDVAAAIALQAAWALGKAHAAGVVHRDLKPENLFLVERTVPGVFVKLLDFGIAKLVRRVQADALTAHGSTLGTPQYMSPEQIQAAPDVDHRTDVWSLGAVLFEALAGRPAYQEKATFAETMLQICQERAPRLAHVAPWVPPALAAVVDDALEPDRERRLSDAPAFAQRILEAVPDALAPASLMVVARAAALATSQKMRAAKQSGDRQSAPPGDPGFSDIAGEEEDADERVFARLGSVSSIRPLEAADLADAPVESSPRPARASREVPSGGASSRPPKQAFALSLSSALGARREPSVASWRPPSSAERRTRADGERLTLERFSTPLRDRRALAVLASAALVALGVSAWMIVASPSRATERSAAASPHGTKHARARLDLPQAPRVARARTEPAAPAAP